jgi:hypothetical protein
MVLEDEMEQSKSGISVVNNTLTENATFVEPPKEKIEVKESANQISIASNNCTSSLSDHNENGNSRKRRRQSELEQLTRNEHRKTTKPGIVQLYASDFDNTANASETMVASNSSRPKRRIKTVQRYSDTRYTHAQQVKLFELAGKCGTGFLCPQCVTHLSYDVKECYSCGVGCCYQPGIGVVILKDREDISKFESVIRSRDIQIDGNPIDNTNGKINNNKLEESIQPPGKRMAPPRKSKSNKHHNGSATVTKRELGSVTISSNISKEWAYDMLANAKAKECEACMQLFLPSYLQRHRKRCHRLVPTEFGCPICPGLPFESMKDRNLHMVESHPGKPINLSDEEKARTKLYLYDCPRCDTSMTYGDLRDHLDKDHSEDINAIKDMVTCTCPFCLQGPNPRRSTFVSTDSFLAHVRENHKGCNVKGEKLKLGGSGIRKRNSSGRTENITTPPHIDSYREKMTPPSFSNNTHEASATMNPPISTSEDFYWYALIPEILIADAKVGSISYKKGALISGIIEALENKIESLREKIKLLPKENAKKDDDEYLFEHRLYIKGIRERKNKAEGEALEKFMYKDKCEEHQRWLDYQSRTKKKSPEELELESLKTRPFLYVSSSGKSVGTRRDKCPFGEGCELCNGWYATCIITNEEISEGDGNVVKAIENLKNEKRSSAFIPSRGFRRITEEDLPDDTSGDKKASESKERTRTRGNGKAEMLRLVELKHSLDFIRDFNRGVQK